MHLRSAKPTKGQAHLRGMQFSVDGIDLDARTIPVSVSSDAGDILRWVDGFGVGYEVLDHSSIKSIDLSRFKGKNGGPQLFNHDMNVIIGRFMPSEVKDGKLYGTVRFGKSVDAERAWQDVQDGILVDTSIRYSYDSSDVVQEGPAGKGEFPTYRITRWALIESSMVTVPADFEVGVGRSAKVGCTNRDCTNDECTNPECEGECSAERKCASCAARSHNPTPPAVLAGTTRKAVIMTPEEIAAAQAAAEALRNSIPGLLRNERAEATQLRNLAGKFGMEREATEILGSDKPMAEARAAIMALIEGKHTPIPAPIIDPNAREMQEYSLLRAMRCAIDGENCAELEISKTLAKGLGRNTDGFFMPTSLRNLRAGLDSSTTTKGTELKYTEPGDFIQILRNKMLVMKMGATFLPGLSGNIAFARQTGAGTAAWLASENPGADAADSNLTLDQVTLSPKTLITSSSYSRQLLIQSSYPLEQKVREDLAAVVAIAMDLAAINGSGASGQPKGILNVAGIGSVALGTNGLIIPSVSPLVDLETAVFAANADADTMGYLTTPGQRGTMKKTPAFSTAGAAPIWTQGTNERGFGDVNGYRAGATLQVPQNLTKGSSSGICHAVIFGNFAELLIGEWQALEILLDPYRLKKQGMIELTGIYMADVQVKHAASFAAIKDAL